MDHDIIIIGAGAAGSMAACFAAGKGFNTVLIERGKRDAYKPSSGIFPKHNMEGFPSLPDSCFDGSLVTARFMSPRTGGLLDAREFDTTLGKVVLRSRFDKYMVDNAEREGACVLEETKVTSAGVNAEDVVVSIHDKQGTTREITGRLLLLATGTGGFHLHGPLGIDVPPVVQSIICEFESSPAHVDTVLSSGAYHYYLNKALTSIGPFWITCRDDGTFNAGMIDQQVSKKAFMDAMNTDPRLKGLFKDAKQVIPPGRDSPIMRATIPAKPIKEPFNDRVLVLGDAAGFPQQFYYEGIWQGRLSAKLAVDVVCNLHDEGKPFTRDNLRQYKKLVARHIVNAFSRSGRKNSYLFWKSRDDEILWDYFCNLIANSKKFRKLITTCFAADYVEKDLDTKAGEMIFSSIPFIKRIKFMPIFLKAATMR